MVKLYKMLQNPSGNSKVQDIITLNGAKNLTSTVLRHTHTGHTCTNYQTQPKPKRLHETRYVITPRSFAFQDWSLEGVTSALYSLFLRAIQFMFLPNSTFTSPTTNPTAIQSHESFQTCPLVPQVACSRSKNKRLTSPPFSSKIEEKVKPTFQSVSTNRNPNSILHHHFTHLNSSKLIQHTFAVDNGIEIYIMTRA